MGNSSASAGHTFMNPDDHHSADGTNEQGACIPHEDLSLRWKLKIRKARRLAGQGEGESTARATS